MANIFNSIRMKRPKRNAFNLSYESKLTLDMGKLVPCMCMPVVPGDKFRVNTEMLVRMAPMIAPIMHRVNVFTHFFFVPNRLVWNEWEKFITMGVDGEDKPEFPTISVNPLVGDAKLFGNGSLWDYLGLPSIDKYQNGDTVGESNGIVNGVTAPIAYKVSSLPFRAYQLIYNEYYRDQNLTDPIEISFGSGAVSVSDQVDLMRLRSRAWEKDYFTSALPWLQRGPEVTIPAGGGIQDVLYDTTTENRQLLKQMDGSSTSLGLNLAVMGDSTGDTYMTGVNDSGTLQAAQLDPNGTLKVDLSDVGINVNDLRTSNALQRWFERNARSGSRYIEQILAHFGVRSSDARLQRPQFLGGGRTPIAVSEVLQTSSTDDVTPQANMAGHGISAGVNHGFTKYFEEHGYIIGIMSILPRTGYQQGVPRDFRKFDNMDFYFPEFAHLSEQEITNDELFLSGNEEANSATFGYTPRYAEYKYHQNEAHGDFRGNLSYWHLNRIFESQPNLNTAFVESNPSNRIFATADTEDNKFWIQLYHDVKALRLMPKYGTPML